MTSVTMVRRVRGTDTVGVASAGDGLRQRWCCPHWCPEKRSVIAHVIDIDVDPVVMTHSVAQMPCYTRMRRWQRDNMPTAPPPGRHR
jgi:hypothetical protein